MPMSEMSWYIRVKPIEKGQNKKKSLFGLFYSVHSRKVLLKQKKMHNVATKNKM